MRKSRKICLALLCFCEAAAGRGGGLCPLCPSPSAPSPSHGEKAQGLTNTFSLPAGMIHHPGRARARAFKQPREAGAGEVQGLGVSCKAWGTPWPWGGQAACRAVRDAGGIPRRKPGAHCTPTSIAHQQLWHRVLAAQSTVTHPDQRLALLRAPGLEQSHRLHPCARPHP